VKSLFARAKAVLPCIALGLAAAQTGLAETITGIIISDYDSLNLAVHERGTSVFASNATISLAGAAEVLMVGTNVVLDGRFINNGYTNSLTTNTVTISRASGAGPMFYIESGGSLTLLNLTLSGGLGTNGGAIYNDTGGTLIISNCVFTGNTATNYAGVDGANATSQGNINGGDGGDGMSAAGGAIVSHGTLEVYYSIFSGNTVSAGNGGNGGNGILSFVFGGNGGNGGNGGSAEGGAIVCTGATNIFVATDFTGNISKAGSGGTPGSPASGAFAGQPGSGGTGGGSVGGAMVASGSLLMSNCLFSGNSAVGGDTSSFNQAGGAATGGGLDLSSSKNAAIIENTTFYQNSCQGGAGGGNSRENLKPAGNGGSATGGGLADSAALTILTNCTLATNQLKGGTAGVSSTSQSNGLPGLTAGYDLAATAGTLKMANSLLYGGTNSIATNTTTTTATLTTYVTNTQPNVFGGITDLGYNMSSDTSVSLGAAGSSENQPVVVDTGLSQPGGTVVGLIDGTTTGSTLALLPGSPGIRAIPGIPGISFPADDQVFQPRSSPTTIGAYEANALDLTSAALFTDFILTNSQDWITNSGEKVELWVTTNDNPYGVGVGVQWQFHGTNLIDGGRIYGARTTNLTITSVTTNDAGTYSVLVGSTTLVTNGILTNKVTLSVYVRAAIVAQPPKTITPEPGEPINISVTAVGDSTADNPLTFQWYLVSFGETNALSDLEPGVTGSTSSTLTLYPLTNNNAGSYFVVVTNQYRSATSSIVSLSIPPPKVALTTTNVTDAMLTVEGKAESDFGVTNVLLDMTNVLYEVGIVTNATDTGDQFSTWSATVPLQAGANTFSVHSVDLLGQVSPAKSFTFFYTTESTLTLLTNGFGTNKPGFTNKADTALTTNGFVYTNMVAGSNYTVRASPGSNALFAGWTGTTNSESNPLTFNMQSNMTLTATFVPNPFPAAKGTYSGLFSATDGVAFGSAGLLQNLVIGDSGAYSGKLYIGATNYPVTGTFDAYGAAANEITNTTTQTSLTLVMNLNSAATPPQVTGSVQQTGGAAFMAANLFAEQAATNVASAEYTVLMPPGTDNIPSGFGCVLVTIVANHLGTATVTGLLADGTAFSQSAAISGTTSNLAIYATPSTNGMLWGLLSLANGSPQGNLAWIRPAAAGGLFTNGFTNFVPVQGELWTNPPAKTAALQCAAGQLNLSGSGTNLVFYVAVTSSNTLVKLGGATNSLTGSIAAKTGLLSVTIGAGNGEPAAAGCGVVLQEANSVAGISNSVAGFFTNSSGAGWITLQTNLSAVAPMIVQQPASHDYVSNATVVFSVQAIGSLPLRYQWQFQGTNLTDGGKISGSASNNLTVSGEVVSNAGSYSVMVFNSVGNVLSSIATLTIAAPTLAITPKPGAATTNNPLTVQGTASDKYGLSAVLWQVNSNGWTAASTTSDWTKWIATNVPLHAGTNTFQAYSVDLNGNHSPTGMVTTFYVTAGTLKLLTNGNGATLPGFANNRSPYPPDGVLYTNLAPGSNYTVKAVAGSNTLFSNWTETWTGANSALVTNTAAANPLPFTMESNMTLTANFVTNPFLPSVGIYNGLFWSSNADGFLEETAGMLYHLVLTNDGTYSGKLLLGATNYLLAGRFSFSGQATNSFGTNPAGGPLVVEMTLETVPAKIIVGTVSSNSWRANLTAELGVTSLSEEYTLLFPTSSSDTTNTPPGDGYALVTNHAGMVTLTGAMADGTAFNETVPESQSGDIPIYASLYSNTGVLIGWVNLANLQAGAPTNTLTWIKEPSKAAVLYPGGFTNTLSVQGAPWFNSTPAIALDKGVLSLTNAATNLVFTVAVLTNNTVAKLGGAPPNSLTGTVDPKTGFLKIHFGNGNGASTTEGLGAFLQDQNTANGFFLTPTNAGALFLAPDSDGN
jgi:hypothetical protein